MQGSVASYQVWREPPPFELTAQRCELECIEYFLNCRVHKVFRDLISLGARQRAVKKSLDDALSESTGRQGAALSKNLTVTNEPEVVGETGLEPVTPCL